MSLPSLSPDVPVKRRLKVLVVKRGQKKGKEINCDQTLDTIKEYNHRDYLPSIASTDGSLFPGPFRGSIKPGTITPSMRPVSEVSASAPVFRVSKKAEPAPAVVEVHPDLQVLTSQRKDSVISSHSNKSETSTLRDLWNQARGSNELTNLLKFNDVIKTTTRPSRYLRTASPQVTLKIASSTGQREKTIIRTREEDDQNLKPDKYYTAVTRRVKVSDPKPFDALVRDFVPLPQLFGDAPSTRQFTKKSIDEWKRQVVKVVPERPEFAVPAKTKPREWAMEVSDAYQMTSKPAFYKAERGAPHRHYKVSPGWISEKVCFKSGKAYKSNIVLG